LLTLFSVQFHLWNFPLGQLVTIVAIPLARVVTSAASRRHGPSRSCFIVRDVNGQTLACVYFEARCAVAKFLTDDEAAHRGQPELPAVVLNSDRRHARRCRSISDGGGLD
jgi:hypothetical protein